MGKWTATAKMSVKRNYHTLTLLPNGQVLAAGGRDGGWGICNNLTSAELYNSGTGSWSATGNMIAARFYHTATLLPNEQVLVAGGQDCEENILSSAELYTPRFINKLPTVTLTTPFTKYSAPARIKLNAKATD